jgi:hypothetical protein
MKTACEALLKVRATLDHVEHPPMCPNGRGCPEGLATGVDFGVTQWPLRGGELAPLKGRFWPAS